MKKIAIPYRGPLPSVPSQQQYPCPPTPSVAHPLPVGGAVSPALHAAAAAPLASAGVQPLAAACGRPAHPALLWTGGPATGTAGQLFWVIPVLRTGGGLDNNDDYEKMTQIAWVYVSVQLSDFALNLTIFSFVF